MSEYIDRKAVMDAFAQRVTRSNNSDFAPAPAWNSAVEIVEQFPAADVQPVVHAHWIPVYNEWDDDTWKCSNCGEPWILIEGYPEDNKMHYCPFCGARMDERSKDNG